jgi:hypothetical protein
MATKQKLSNRFRSKVNLVCSLYGSRSRGLGLSIKTPGKNWGSEGLWLRQWGVLVATIKSKPSGNTISLPVINGFLISD